jgi:hypothetical protein
VLFPPLAATAALLIWLWPHLREATRLWPWDDYTYHMVYPALWLGERAIVAPTPIHAFTTQAWYPLSASVVATWFMAPYAGARAEALAWVSLTGPLYAALFVAGVGELFARLRCRPGAWAVPVVLFATSARIGVMASSFSDADLAHATALFGALVFSVPRGETERRADVVADTWYAALLTGFALGVKVSAAPAALIVLALMLRRTRGGVTSRPWWRDGVVTVAIFAASWIATSGYWYARNLMYTGNPVYPAAFLIWPGATFPETTLREYARHYGLARAFADALHVYLLWPPTHALLGMLGFTAMTSGLVLRRGAMARPSRYFACGALALVAAILMLLPSMPYAAGNAMTFRSGFIHWDSMRYVALLPLLGWAALGFVIDGGAGAPAWRLLAASVISAGPPLALRYERSITLLLLLGLVVAAVLLAFISGVVPSLQRQRQRQGPLLAVSFGALVLGVLVAVSHNAKTVATAGAIHSDPLFGAAARVLDAQPAGVRVAVFGDQWIYPAFGARHHLAPVRLDRDGRVAAQPIGDAMEPGELTVDSTAFRANLRAAGVGIVVVLRQPHPGRSDERPGQERALQAQSDVRLLHRDRATVIFALEP